MQKQYAKRDAEFEKFAATAMLSERRAEQMRPAFNAGWAARKQADYQAILGMPGGDLLHAVDKARE